MDTLPRMIEMDDIFSTAKEKIEVLLQKSDSARYFTELKISDNKIDSRAITISSQTIFNNVICETWGSAVDTKFKCFCPCSISGTLFSYEPVQVGKIRFYGAIEESRNSISTLLGIQSSENHVDQPRVISAG